MAGQTLIQIYRSVGTDVPASLSNGELAYTSNGGILYIGDPANGDIKAIGSERTPGVLTANLAIVTNSTNMIDKLMLGNTTVNVVANSLAVTLANSTVTFSLTKPSAAQVSSGDFFLGSDGTWQQPAGSATSLDGLSDVTITSPSNNQILVYDEAGAVFENHGTGNGISFDSFVMSVLGANGITVTSSGVNVLGTNGMVSNTTGLWLTPGEGLITNSTGLHVGTGNGVGTNSTAVFVVPGTNGGIVANTTGTWVKAANGISLTAAGVNVLGGPTITVNTSGVHVNASLSITDLTLAGNLTVSGTLVTVDATNIQTKDSLISLADQQANTGSFTDALDIGIYGQWGNTAESHYGGLFRDASDSGIWSLFEGAIPTPTTTIDTANVNYALASLKLNSLTLTNALTVSNGGTGLTSVTDQDILVANDSGGLSLLSLGTAGLVLQSNGTALIYDTLDGGTF